jgi:hypothetical protein
MSIGPIEIDRVGSDLAELGADAIRLVTGPSRIGWRIHTIKGVDRNDFHADRIDSATLSADSVISAELRCERFDAVFSIIATPDYLATILIPKLYRFEHSRSAYTRNVDAAQVLL